MVRSLGRTGHAWRMIVARLRKPGPNGELPVCSLCGLPIDLTLQWPDLLSFTVHHLDGNKDNNDPGNHAPAHLTCNSSEGARSRWQRRPNSRQW